ncbi:hypothetical protein COCNU_01G000420 [Cocos nucifera]|uniref:NBS-LRR resistance protein n=1 Tax=Cocos nucifera TaxID=13894 RepID=A0A8K0HTG2_COCNU|nr:hypothetical protein COCNU_01G000420 [Cocos nucifera]
MGSISRYSRKLCELITLHKIGSEIEKIKIKIHGISEGTKRCGGESGAEKSSDWDDGLRVMRWFPPHFFDDTDVMGFEDDCVISLVGMGTGGHHPTPQLENILTPSLRSGFRFSGIPNYEIAEGNHEKTARHAEPSIPPHELQPLNDTGSLELFLPPNQDIPAELAKRLWTAEGFIPQEQTRTMEETARNCLDDLVQRCMIQVVRQEAWLTDGLRGYASVEGLRELGISEAKKDGFLHVCSSDDMAVSNDDKRSHRAAFHDPTMNDEVAVSSPHIRTLLGFNLDLKDGAAAGRFLNGLNLLRVLENLEELPERMGNMIHLRYLGFGRTALKRPPSSIGRLLNLQTLDVRDANILWLPKSFWKIRTLRHLYVY